MPIYRRDFIASAAATAAVAMMPRAAFAVAGIGSRVSTYTDASGLVSASIFQLISQDQQAHFTDFGVNVDQDMVAIGGGGTAAEFPQGALLTASYPNDDLTGWLVSSKDHEVSNPHFLTAYAIGLKIKGMSRDDLFKAITVITADSGVQSHPTVKAVIEEHPNVLLVGGGFKVDWHGAGNLGTGSWPADDSAWAATSKDHDIADPANLRAYAIGLRQQLPVGPVSVKIDRKVSGSGAEHPAAVARMSSGFAITGGGAESVTSWAAPCESHAGSLLWKLQPQTRFNQQEFSGASKSHMTPCATYITAYALGIKIG